MNFCLARSEHTWLWPEKKDGFDVFLWSHSRATDLGLSPLAQSAVLYGRFFFFFKQKSQNTLNFSTGEKVEQTNKKAQLTDRRERKQTLFILEPV